MYKKFFRGFRVSYIFLALIIVVSILSMFDYPQGLFLIKTVFIRLELLQRYLH